LNKLHVESCSFFNLLTPGPQSVGQGLPPADLKLCHWVKPSLRQPVSRALREDKSASEVVREQVSAAIS
jgi:hypothetical protein